MKELMNAVFIALYMKLIGVGWIYKDCDSKCMLRSYLLQLISRYCKTELIQRLSELRDKLHFFHPKCFSLFISVLVFSFSKINFLLMRWVREAWRGQWVRQSKVDAQIMREKLSLGSLLVGAATYFVSV